MLDRPQVVELKIPEYMVRPKQKEDLKLAYSLFETDESSGITMVEARSILWNFGYWKLTKQQFEAALQENHINSNKERLSWEEILLLVTKKYYSGGKNERIREIFEVFDTKNKGILNVQDIQKVFRENLEFSVSDNEILDILEGDTENIGYSDFVSM
jgi:Ca2+-binding EF-hand superfamily protein